VEDNYKIVLKEMRNNQALGLGCYLLKSLGKYVTFERVGY
jgi:hypothetical protein